MADAEENSLVAPAAPVASVAPVAPVAHEPSLETALSGDDLPAEAVLRKADEKPPRYRFVRGAMYAIYLLVVTWFVAGISVAVWQSVWGEQGLALQAKEHAQ